MFGKSHITVVYFLYGLNFLLLKRKTIIYEAAIKFASDFYSFSSFFKSIFNMFAA